MVKVNWSGNKYADRPLPTVSIEEADRRQNNSVLKGSESPGHLAEGSTESNFVGNLVAPDYGRELFMRGISSKRGKYSISASGSTERLPN